MYQEAKDWMAEAILRLKQFRGSNPTEVTIYYYLKRERDIDGSVKLVLDAMTKAEVFKDDKEVTDLHLYKRWDKQNPHLELSWGEHKTYENGWMDGATKGFGKENPKLI